MSDPNRLAAKLHEFEHALAQFVERMKADRNVLAVVAVGSLNEETIWRREAIWLWIIEADGVNRRLLSDGKDERVFRVLVEESVNIWAELIPRTRFKQMVEGASRTAFSCNFFAKRQLLFSNDQSIQSWFETANLHAVKDQEKELVAFTTWTIHSHRHALRLLQLQEDVELAAQEIIGAAHSIAHTEIIRAGEVCESEVIYRAMELNPELFQTIYLEVLAKRRNKRVLQNALNAIDEYLVRNYPKHLKPLLAYLKKNNRTVALSELGDHFAYSQLYPWHFLSACDWLEEQGVVEKLSAAFKLTKRSQEEVEEPAYFMDS